MKKQHDNSLRFLLAWVGSSVIVWPVSIFLCLIFFASAWFAIDVVDELLAMLAPYGLLRVFGLLLMGLLPGLAVGFVLGDLQQRAMQMHLGQRVPHWMRVTLLGGALAGTITVLSTLFLGEYSARMYWEMIALPLFMLVLSAVQWWYLRQHVARAWMWTLANAVAGVVFVGLMAMNQPGRDNVWYPILQIGLWLIASVAQGLTTGIVLLWLFDHHHDHWDDGERDLARVYVEVRARDTIDRYKN